MKNITILLFLILAKCVSGQQILYVRADNGLIVRKSPDKNSERIGKLDYGTGVQVL